MLTPSLKGLFQSHMNKHHKRAVRHEVGRGANHTCLTFGLLVHVPHLVTYLYAVHHEVGPVADRSYHNDDVHPLLLHYMSVTVPHRRMLVISQEGILHREDNLVIEHTATVITQLQGVPLTHVAYLHVHVPAAGVVAVMHMVGKARVIVVNMRIHPSPMKMRML